MASNENNGDTDAGLAARGGNSEHTETSATPNKHLTYKDFIPERIEIGDKKSSESIEYVLWQLCGTLYDSYRTGTIEIVQAITSVEKNIKDSKEMKIWDQIMYL